MVHQLLQIQGKNSQRWLNLPGESKGTQGHSSHTGMNWEGHGCHQVPFLLRLSSKAGLMLPNKQRFSSLVSAQQLHINTDS